MPHAWQRGVYLTTRLTKKAFFLQGSAFLLLALVKKDQMRNEKELIAFGLDMSSRDNNKISTTTFLMSFDCLIRDRAEGGAGMAIALPLF